eukprot:gene24355-29440_t
MKEKNPLLPTAPPLPSEDYVLVQGVGVEEEELPIGEGSVHLDQNCPAAIWRGIREEPHIPCAIINILCLLFFGLKLASLGNDQNSEDDIPWGYIAIFFYVVLLVEAACSKTARYVWNQHDLQKATTYMHQIKAAEPVICEEVCCFHMEPRVRTVTYHETITETYHEDGRTKHRTIKVPRTRIETYMEKVVRHRDKLQICFDNVVDFTIVPNVNEYSICKLTCTKSWHPTTDTQGVYDYAIYNFKQKHAYCDNEREFSSSFELPGFLQDVLVYVSDAHIPFILRHGAVVFSIATVCLLGWVYRIYLSGIVGRQIVHVSKEVHVCPHGVL